MNEFLGGFLMGAATTIAALAGLIIALIAWRDEQLMPRAPEDPDDWRLFK